MCELVNNICRALYSLRSLFPSSISLSSSHWGIKEERLPDPIPNSGHCLSRVPGPLLSTWSGAKVHQVPWAGLNKSSPEPLSAGNQPFPLPRAPSTLTRGGEPGRCPGAGPAGSRLGDRRHPAWSRGMQWAGAAAPPASPGNSCYVKRSEGEFTVSVNNR